MTGPDHPVVARPGTRVGVDVGSVRVGLAVSDPAGSLAMPVDTLPRDTSPARSDQARIAGLVREREAVEVVAGLPLLMSGLEGEAARLARSYAGELALLVAPVPVRLVDERLTTVQSHRTLRESGVAGRAQRKVVDQAAAVLILQAALDGERATGRAQGELVEQVAPMDGGDRDTKRRRPRRKDPRA